MHLFVFKKMCVMQIQGRRFHSASFKAGANWSCDPSKVYLSNALKAIVTDCAKWKSKLFFLDAQGV